MLVIEALLVVIVLHLRNPFLRPVQAALFALVLLHGLLGVRAILLDAESIPFIDLSAAEMLDRLAEKLKGQGQRLMLAKDIGQVRQILTAAGSSLEAYVTLDDAVAAFQRVDSMQAPHDAA